MENVTQMIEVQWQDKMTARNPTSRVNARSLRSISTNMAPEYSLKNVFKSQKAYIELFDKTHTIWQFVDRALGQTIVFINPNRSTWGFNVNRTLSVNYERKEGMRRKKAVDLE